VATFPEVLGMYNAFSSSQDFPFLSTITSTLPAALLRLEIFSDYSCVI
jgi:hypothetical protein